MTERWYNLKYETLEWHSKDNEYLSRNVKSKILPTYESSIPDTIFDKDLSLPSDLEARISDLMVNLSRFDAIQSQKGYAFPKMLLRSESASSSQIENLTSSIRNIAWAELSSKLPQNAELIAANVRAMRVSLELPNTFTKSGIMKIHKTLLELDNSEYAGVIRDVPVWIGGHNYSPHGAIFVPPHQRHLDMYLEDLFKYASRIDINPIVKAAILHAQFETIHPFVDGNGRTGRTLIHKSLRVDNVIQSVTLPISSGLLNNSEAYMNALLSFQTGDPLPIIEQITGSLELALYIGQRTADQIAQITEEWNQVINERKNSAIWKLIDIIIEQPVINTKYLEENLNISTRTANNLIDRAISYGLLRRIGTEKRGIFYQSDAIIEVMDEVSSLETLRRMPYQG